jgi:hypothetical protein
MSPALASALSLVASLGAAVCWAKYIRAVARRGVAAAVLWDAAIVASSMATVQLWAYAGEAPAVLAARVVGSAAGTWLVLRVAGARGG